MINIGIIGLGDIGTVHLRGFSRLENECRITAVCDPDKAKQQRALNLLGGKSTAYSDYRKMLREAPLDAVVIGIPTWSHAPVALAAMRAGKDVFLEKPVAPTIEECDSFIMEAFKSNRIVQVGLVYRYSNLYRTVGSMVDRGDYGRVMMMYCKEYRDNFPVQWFFETKKSGGALLDKDCHHFDLFNWFIRSRAMRVMAMGGQHVVKGKRVKVNCGYAPDPDAIIKNPDILDHAFVMVEYENEARANLGLCMYEVEPLEGLEIGLMGDNGTHALAKRDIRLDSGGGPLGEMQEIPVDYEGDNLALGHIGIQVEHIEFLKCVRERKMPFANLLIARDSMDIAFAADRSIAEKRSVLLSEFANPKVEKLRKKHFEELYQPTPAPMKPPKLKKETETAAPDNLLEMIIELIRSIFKKAPKGKFQEFNPETFKRAAERLNNDDKYRKLAKGLYSKVAFEHAGKPKVTAEFRDGRVMIFSEPHFREQASIVFTPEGWKEVFEGASAQKLAFTRRVYVKGNMDTFRGYTDAMGIVLESLRKG
jgi:myo-inositol 2-dehydrogenase / D-chiro-inositol 1-dehydrogenase